MLVQIKGIAQALSFETGESYSYLTLLLPTGKEVHATVADDVIAELTAMFMGSGSPAAQEATARVQAAVAGAPPPPRRSAPAQSPAEDAYEHMTRPSGELQQDRSFAPVGFSDEAVSFGGDFRGDQDELRAIEQSLAAAEDKLAHAIGDTSTASPAELRQVVARIQQPAMMPVPNILEPPQRKQARRVEADSFGNPVIAGAGLVDPRSLMGGDTEGEEDAGQA